MCSSDPINGRGTRYYFDRGLFYRSVGFVLGYGMTGTRRLETRICIECGVEFVGKAPATLCPMHALEHKRAVNRAHKAWLKANGWCLDCGDKAVPGKVLCEKCAERRRAYMKEYWEKGKRKKA